MISTHLLDSVSASAILTHLLQSTGFVGLAWLLTLALRNYPARVRFWMWMCATLKFLVPFAWLTSAGARWAPVRPHPVRSVFYTVVEEFNKPLGKGGPVLPELTTGAHQARISWIAITIVALWCCGCVVMLLRWVRPWLRARCIVKAAAPASNSTEATALWNAAANARVNRRINVALTSQALEPGIFGVFRPLLMWPEGLSQQLDEAQIQAIMAHEVEHVRRRDNLCSAVHAFVEVLFWFHPAVHWMRLKMSEERERACDERVLLQSAQPQKYAESILKVCAFCLESPLPCVAGVSGSDLKLRVLRILKHRSEKTLTTGRRILLSAMATCTIALPIGLGVVRGQAGTVTNTGAAVNLPKYEVASIKPAASDEGRSIFRLTPDGMAMQGVAMQMLLRTAFGVEPDRIIGAPSWVSSKRYDIEAKVAPEDAPKLEKIKAEDRSAMLLPLLVERFNLKYHHETRDLPMYTLVVAKGGPKLTASKEGSASDASGTGAGAPKGPANMRGRMMMMPGRIEGQSATVDVLARMLSPQLGHTVVDKTGLTGNYDYTLQWTPDDAAMPMAGGPAGGPGGAPGREANAAEAGGPSLFTAIEEQLGLKLDSTKGPVDVIVIDHLDLPSAN